MLFQKEFYSIKTFLAKTITPRIKRMVSKKDLENFDSEVVGRGRFGTVSISMRFSVILGQKKVRFI